MLEPVLLQDQNFSFDGAKEFDERFGTYLAAHGILHHLSSL